MRWFGVFLGLAVAVAGCSLAIGELADEQCSTDDDCQTLGLTGTVCRSGTCQDPSRACIDEPFENPFDPRPFTLEIRATDVSTVGAQERTPPGLSATACIAPLIECDQPLVGAVDEPNGLVSFEMASGAPYLVTLEAPDFMPLLHAFRYPVVAPEGSLRRFYPQAPMLSVLQFNLLALSVGVQTRDDRGHAFVIVNDCELEFVEGAEVEVAGAGSEATSVVYVGPGNIPSDTLTATSELGVAVVINAPTSATLRITGPDGQPHNDPVAIPTAPGTVTYISVPSGPPSQAPFVVADDATP